MAQPKNRNIFITATNTNVGKTYITEQLIYYYSLFQFKVGVLKPIETGVVNNQPVDGLKLLNQSRKYNPEMRNISINEVVPYQFELPASPYVAKGETVIDIQNIKNSIKYLEKYCDILLIEGAGGLMVPIEVNYFMLDLIKELNYKTFLVSPSNLGSINDTLLSIDKLSKSGINFDWAINLYKDKEEFSKVTEPFYKAYFGDFKIFQKNSIQIANRLIFK